MLAVELCEEGHALYWNGDDDSREGEMPTNDEVFESMDAAADQAKVDLFALFDSLGDEEAEGAKIFIGWFLENYQDVGFRRLGRVIKELPGRMLP